MDYLLWSSQYLNQAQQIKEHLQTLSPPADKLTSSQLRSLHFRKQLLYQMYLELCHTGMYLQNYRRRD